MRLNRFLASAGLGSRRACEELILSGRVTINGTSITDLATQVSPADHVKVGRRLVRPKSRSYILLYKPPGYICTRSDEQSRRTIFDLIPKEFGRLFHVGRLDKESEGLIILTNDGDFAQQLTHPSHQIDKEYDVTVDKPFDVNLIPKLVRGITLEVGRARMESVRPISPNRMRIVLRQGLKRQIREMLWTVGYRVERLTRIRIGPLADERLKPGRWRPLLRDEIAKLSAAGHSGPLKK